MIRHLADWTLPDLLAARRELQSDYWKSGPRARVLIEPHLIDIEVEILHREQDLDGSAATCKR